MPILILILVHRRPSLVLAFLHTHPVIWFRPIAFPKVARAPDRNPRTPNSWVEDQKNLQKVSKPFKPAHKTALKRPFSPRNICVSFGFALHWMKVFLSETTQLDLSELERVPSLHLLYYLVHNVGLYRILQMPRGSMLVSQLKNTRPRGRKNAMFRKLWNYGAPGNWLQKAIKILFSPFDTTSPQGQYIG